MCKEFCLPRALGGCLEDIDKGFSDSFALGLRVRDALEFLEEKISGLLVDELNFKISTKDLAHYLGLPRSEHAIIDKYTGELFADGAVQERGGAGHCAATYNKPLINLVGPKWEGIAPDPLICDAIHHVDILRWLAGPSQCEAALPVAVYSEVEDGERLGTHRHNAVIHFDSGAIAAMMSHYGVGYRIQRAEVHAEDLSIYMDLTRGPHCEFYDGQQEGRDPQEPLDLEAVGGANFNEVRHFVDCILADQKPWSTLDDAIHTMRLCEAIRGGHKGALDTTSAGS